MMLVKSNLSSRPFEETGVDMIKVVVVGSDYWGKNLEQTIKSKMRSK